MICGPDDIQADFYLLRDGPVLITSDRDLWQVGTHWLRDDRGYRCHEWQLRSQAAFHAEVSETLLWDEQFGYTPWNGNLDALNDGLVSCPFAPGRIVITIDNADRLKGWFGKEVAHLWSMLVDAARVQLLFGAGILILVYTPSNGDATQWSEAKGLSLLTRNMFPDTQLVIDGGRA